MSKPPPFDAEGEFAKAKAVADHVLAHVRENGGDPSDVATNFAGLTYVLATSKMIETGLITLAAAALATLFQAEEGK